MALRTKDLGNELGRVGGGGMPKQVWPNDKRNSIESGSAMDLKTSTQWYPNPFPFPPTPSTFYKDPRPRQVPNVQYCSFFPGPDRRKRVHRLG